MLSRTDRLRPSQPVHYVKNSAALQQVIIAEEKHMICSYILSQLNCEQALLDRQNSSRDQSNRRHLME